MYELADQCEATRHVRYSSGDGWMHCILPRNHEGPHADSTNTAWDVEEDDPIRWWEWFLGAAALIGAGVGVLMVVKGLLYIFALLHG